MNTGGKEMGRYHEVGTPISADTALVGCVTIACLWSHMMLPIKQVTPLSTFPSMRICVKLGLNNPQHQQTNLAVLTVLPSCLPYLLYRIVLRFLVPQARILHTLRVSVPPANRRLSLFLVRHSVPLTIWRLLPLR